jgi:hypothetical protein
MKAFVLSLFLVLGFASVSFAQQPAADQPVVKTIFDYQKEIGLSEKQGADMKKFAMDLQTTLNEKAKELMTLRSALGEMIKTKADIAVIKKQMQKIANLQVDNSCLDIQASRNIEAVMTKDQLNKWKEIQQKFMEELQAAQAKAQAAAAEPAVAVPAKK